MKNGRRAVIAAVIGSVAACGGQAGDSATAQASARDTGACAEAPVLTWANFGDGFVTENCQACHASTTPDRRGAPQTVTFDTYEDTMAHRDRILARSGGDDPTMPPQGGVDAAQREKLTLWLTCGEAP